MKYRNRKYGEWVIPAPRNPSQNNKGKFIMTIALEIRIFS
jgi:hypothetical protein